MGLERITNSLLTINNSLWNCSHRQRAAVTGQLICPSFHKMSVANNSRRWVLQTIKYWSTIRFVISGQSSAQRLVHQDIIRTFCPLLKQMNRWHTYYLYVTTWTERERARQTDRQSDRQRESETETERERQRDRQTDREKKERVTVFSEETVKETERERETQTEMARQRKTEKQGRRRHRDQQKAYVWHKKAMTDSLNPHHSIDRKQLVPSFQAVEAVRHTTWDDARDVDRWTLLFASHYIESKTFLGFRQFNNTRMSMPLTCCKCSNCSLQRRKEMKNVIVLCKDKRRVIHGMDTY